MHIILTHEQADFDALASMLGAYLLNENVLPVLPRRLNRNVRSFLTLYGAELPFIEARDLPPGNIESITLVDTQSLVTIKGMTNHTKVYVVDHHQESTEIDNEWIVKIEHLGACTTLFVEDLREHNGSLSMIHATLLLLGIYEDTGSLTYVGTLPRDLWAAAFLLEQGANLRITADYLNTALTPEQLKLYDRLLASMELHTLQGQKIILACAEAMNLMEEISSVAHKLRDLLELDALFLLVKTIEGIRIVARSSTDQINVSKIAAFFGGGGHERAAAALVQNDTILPGDQHPVTLERLHDELIRVLPQYVLPSLTVRQIMSRHPLLLSPTTSAQEAAQLMQRFGYEGYPVVEDRKIIGLLTRRAVDRAIAHKLNLSASSLMDAGEVFVYPDTSIDELQRKMTSSGWGQLPVLDEKNDEIIGIVTRTDILTTLTQDKPSPSKRVNLAQRLEASLSVSRIALLKTIAEQAHQQHQGLYIVGGFVRDLLLERPSQDFDLVVEGDAISLARSLTSIYGGHVVCHGRFGTAKWWIADIRQNLHQQILQLSHVDIHDLPESLDLISARTEFYEYPTALPKIKRGSIKLDLHRRDFSINTLALRLDGRHYGDLNDYWGGLNDLRKGLVRVLHSLSFVDDPTRMLRAVRFEQRFGFTIEERTLQLMEEARPLIRQVSGTRLRHELTLLLLESNPEAMLKRLEELELLSAIHSDLHWSGVLSIPLETVLLKPIDPEWQLPEEFERLPLRLALAYIVWLTGLPYEKNQSIAKRLCFPGDLPGALKTAHELWNELPGLVSVKPSLIVERLQKVPIIVLYALYCLEMPGKEQNDADIRCLIRNYIYRWRRIRQITDGHGLRLRGLKPGPWYKQILERLRAAWLDEEISNLSEEEKMLEKIINQIYRGDEGGLIVSE